MFHRWRFHNHFSQTAGKTGLTVSTAKIEKRESADLSVRFYEWRTDNDNSELVVEIDSGGRWYVGNIKI